jgi:type II secretory ATPase GspE/PulE/Tfp pilus assembly ATPase PilB-like protein
MRAFVRHNPNIIVVGELRDKETADIAVHAALTGHLVLTTLHSETAAGAVPRLIDLGVEPFLLKSTLRLIVAQRLVRQLCERCKIRRRLASQEFERDPRLTYLGPRTRLRSRCSPGIRARRRGGRDGVSFSWSRSRFRWLRFWRLSSRRRLSASSCGSKQTR